MGGCRCRAERLNPPLVAVAREVLEESGLPLEGWEAVATFDHDDVPGSDTPGAQRWHCFVALPAIPLPDTWRCQPQGSAVERSLRFEYRWIALSGDEALAGKQEEARRAVAVWASARGAYAAVRDHHRASAEGARPQAAEPQQSSAGGVRAKRALSEREGAAARRAGKPQQSSAGGARREGPSEASSSYNGQVLSFT